jgi:hypothetical protein
VRVERGEGMLYGGSPGELRVESCFGSEPSQFAKHLRSGRPFAKN